MVGWKKKVELVIKKEKKDKRKMGKWLKQTTINIEELTKLVPEFCLAPRQLRDLRNPMSGVSCRLFFNSEFMENNRRGINFAIGNLVSSRMGIQQIRIKEESEASVDSAVREYLDIGKVAFITKWKPVLGESFYIPEDLEDKPYVGVDTLKKALSKSFSKYKVGQMEIQFIIKGPKTPDRIIAESRGETDNLPPLREPDAAYSFFKALDDKVYDILKKNNDGYKKWHERVMVKKEGSTKPLDGEVRGEHWIFKNNTDFDPKSDRELRKAMFCCIKKNIKKDADGVFVEKAYEDTVKIKIRIPPAKEFQRTVFEQSWESSKNPGKIKHSLKYIQTNDAGKKIRRKNGSFAIMPITYLYYTTGEGFRKLRNSSMTVSGLIGNMYEMYIMNGKVGISLSCKLIQIRTDIPPPEINRFYIGKESFGDTTEDFSDDEEEGENWRSGIANPELYENNGVKVISSNEKLKKTQKEMDYNFSKYNSYPSSHTPLTESEKKDLISIPKSGFDEGDEFSDDGKGNVLNGNKMKLTKREYRRNEIMKESNNKKRMKKKKENVQE